MLFENLKKAREAMGLSQKEVAEKVGITQQAYGSMENGLKMPSVSTLSALADVFEKTTDELLGRTKGDESA